MICNKCIPQEYTQEKNICVLSYPVEVHFSDIFVSGIYSLPMLH